MTGTLISISLGQLQSDLDKELTSILKAGVKAWLATAVSIIPVWSGASRGTLIKLGQTVGVQITAFPVKTVDKTGRVRNTPNRVNLGVEKSQGEILIQFPNYAMFWRSDLDGGKHLNYNEENDASLVGFNLKTPTPYHFRIAADKAFFAATDPLMAKLNFKLQFRAINLG